MNEREAKVRFSRVMLGVEADQGPADETARGRGDASVDERAPNHIAGNDPAASVEGQRDAGRQPPEHADEADEKQCRLQQTDAEIGREIREVARILMDALVGIDADLSSLRQEEHAPRREPFGEEVARERLAHLHPQHLVEPGLSDVEHEQRARDLAEHDELREKIRQMAARQRVVEGLVPSVELDLPIGRRGDHADESDIEPEKPGAAARGAQDLKHRRELCDETAEALLNGIGRLRPLRRFFRHWATLPAAIFPDHAAEWPRAAMALHLYF